MGAALQAKAIVLSEPLKLGLQDLALQAPGSADVVVDVAYSGVSTGTEKLLLMAPCRPFPVCPIPWCLATSPSAESVRRPEARGLGRETGCLYLGQTVLKAPGDSLGALPRASWFPPSGPSLVDSTLKEKGVLLALAATAVHCLRPAGGHGARGLRLPRAHRWPRRAGASHCSSHYRPGGRAADGLGRRTRSGSAALTDTGYLIPRPTPVRITPVFLRSAALRRSSTP